MNQPVNSPSIRTQYAPAAEYCRLTLEEEDHLDDGRPEALCFRRGAGPNCHHVVNVGLFSRSCCPRAARKRPCPIC